MDSYFRSNDPANFANHPTLPYFWQRRNVAVAEEKALAFSHTFLGVRLECAQCHKHPFDRWTKNDFKQFTAFFGVDRRRQPPRRRRAKRSPTPSINKETEGQRPTADGRGQRCRSRPTAAAVEVATRRREGRQGHERPSRQTDGQEGSATRARLSKISRSKAIDEDPPPDRRRRTGPVGRSLRQHRRHQGHRQGNKGGKVDPSIQPKMLGGEVVAVPKGTDSRQPLMDWLRSKSNPYFAKAIVNRVWATLFQPRHRRSAG